MSFERTKQMFVSLISYIVFFLVYTNICFGQSTGIWIDKFPKYTNLYSVVYGKEQFVSVGTKGLILTSLDGITWKIMKSGVIKDLISVIYANNIYVAVGDDGTIITSADAINWTEKESGSNSFLDSIAYGKNKFVIISTDGSILTSKDATTWMLQCKEKLILSRVAYVKNQFYIVGSLLRSNIKSYILSSHDTMTWTKNELDTSYDLRYIFYSMNQFVALDAKGAIFTSADAINWTENRLDSRGSNSITQGNNLLVSVGDGGIINTSYDLKKWKKINSGINNDLFSVAYGAKRFVAVGGDCAILTSPDGTTWTEKKFGHTSYDKELNYWSGNWYPKYPKVYHSGDVRKYYYKLLVKEKQYIISVYNITQSKEYELLQYELTYNGDKKIFEFDWMPDVEQYKKKYIVEFKDENNLIFYRYDEKNPENKEKDKEIFYRKK